LIYVLSCGNLFSPDLPAGSTAKDTRPVIFKAQKENKTMTGNATFTPGEKQATPNRNAALMPVRDWQADYKYLPCLGIYDN
jgi:hypothetical protein